MKFYLANECEEGAVQFPGTFCEHCGDFDESDGIVTVCDGGTYWCETCVQYDIFSDEELQDLSNFIENFCQDEDLIQQSFGDEVL